MIAFFIIGIENQPKDLAAAESVIKKINSTTTIDKNIISYSHKKAFIPAKIKILNELADNKRYKESFYNFQIVETTLKNDSIKIQDEHNQIEMTTNTVINEVHTTIKQDSLFTKSLFIQNDISKTELKNDDLKETSLFSYRIYATPSFGLNSFNINNNTPNESLLNKNSSLNNQSTQSNVISSWNFEAGGSVIMNVTKSLRFKAGMQLNYSRYQYQNNNATDNFTMNTGSKNELPSSIHLTMEDPLLQMKSEQQMKMDLLNKYSYQFSIPFGTEFEITGNKKIQWFAGATIQPGLFISEQQSNFEETSNLNKPDNIFRKWNCNTSIETFLSYKLKNGMNINLGPQFRYQLFSAFYDHYLYNDRLYNIGLKLGITNSF